MSRPDWLPDRYGFERTRGAMVGVGALCCDWCDATENLNYADTNLLEWPEGDPSDAVWCDDCEDRAKAAICGGDDGE